MIPTLVSLSLEHLYNRRGDCYVPLVTNNGYETKNTGELEKP